MDFPGDAKKNFSGDDRRTYIRVHKNYILSYFNKDTPDQVFEITQLKNISMGGMCFITSRLYPPSTHLGIKLKTPYLTDTTYMEGVVLDSHEKAKDLIYETRLQFSSLDVQAKFLLEKLVEYFVKGVHH